MLSQRNSPTQLHRKKAAAALCQSGSACTGAAAVAVLHVPCWGSGRQACLTWLAPHALNGHHSSVILHITEQKSISSVSIIYAPCLLRGLFLFDSGGLRALI